MVTRSRRHPASGTDGHFRGRVGAERGHAVYRASQGRSAARARAAKHRLRDGAHWPICRHLFGCDQRMPAPRRRGSRRSRGGQRLPRSVRGRQRHLPAASSGTSASSCATAASPLSTAASSAPPAWRPNATWLYLSGPGGERCCGPVRGWSAAGRDPGRGTGPGLRAQDVLCGLHQRLDCAADCGPRRGAVAGCAGCAAGAVAHGRGRPGCGCAAPRPQRDGQGLALRRRDGRDRSHLRGPPGLPGGFHAAAGDIYRRLAGFKDATETPSLEEVLAALLGADESSGAK